MNHFGSRARENEPMSRHTTFGVGGPADYFIEAHTSEDMVTAVNLAVNNSVDYFIVGGGSNLLVSDSGYRGAIIKSGLNDFNVESQTVTVGSGHNLELLIDKLCERGLAGFESLAGIKGSVGGAIFGNAGAYGAAISDCLVSAMIFKPGQEARIVDKNYFDFSYRHSILKQTGEVVLEAEFKFESDSPERLKKKVREILEIRGEKHPESDCSAGCFFKNIEKADEEHGKLAAGALLDKVGAKSLKVGNAGVYKNHANILVNLGGAKADDIKELALILKKKVKDELGYELQEEITYLGDFS